MNWMRKLGFVLLAFSLSATAAWAQDTTTAAELTYTSQDGRLSFSYPAGWVSRSSSRVTYLANNETALGYSYGARFAPGHIQVSVYNGTLEDVLPQTDVDADASAAEILEAAVAQVTPEDNTTFESIETPETADYDAAGVRFTSDGFEGYAFFAVLDDEYFTAFQVLTAEGEYSRWRVKINDLIASLDYHADDVSGDEPLELTETYSAPEDGIISVSYPAGWAAQASSPAGVDFASSEDALDLWLYDSFEAGDVHLSILYGTIDDLLNNAPSSDMTPLEVLEYTLETNAENDERITNIEAPEALSVNDRQAAVTRVEVRDSTSTLLIIEYLDGMYVAAMAQSRSEEIDRWEGVLLDILATLEVGEPASS